MSFKISIITPSYNQGNFIRDTIESVLDQDYDNFEHIIIDGGSTDNTIEVLKQYGHLRWLSKKDSGPVEAITKGISIASGQIVTWLNSDDYFEKNIFNKVLNEFSDNSKIIIGNMVQINSTNECFLNDNEYTLVSLIRQNPDVIKQPSTFFKKELFDEAGGFDTSLRLVWDYDLFIKMFKIAKPKFVNKVFAYQRIYETNLSHNSPRTQALELYKVSKRNGANILDNINCLLVKRILFPSMNKRDPSILVRLLRRIKRFVN